MLNERWNILKSNFKKRILICIIVVVSATLFDIFLHPLLRLIWVISFFVSVELFTFIYAKMFISQAWLMLTHRQTVEIPIPNEIFSLANQMKVKIKKLKVRPDLNNAYVMGESVVLGEELVKNLNKTEIIAVVAHELAHIKGKHFAVRFLSAISFSFFAYMAWMDLPPIMQLTSTLAYLIVCMIAPNWILETRADRTAIRFVGKKHLRSALRKLVKKEDRNKSSEEHPSVANRTKIIDAMKC